MVEGTGVKVVDVGSEIQAFDGEEQRKSMELAAAAVAAAAKAEVEAGYIIAMKRPRSEDLARTKILDRCKNLRFADSAKFRKPMGKKKVAGKWIQNYVEGLSVRFAEEMLRNWGNIKVLQNVIYEDNFKRLVKVTVIDLESNMSYTSELTVEKHVERKSSYKREVLQERIKDDGESVYIVKATEDEISIKTAANVSKMIRNNGLKCIPGHIKAEARDVIDATLKAGIDDDPEKHKRQIVDSFSSIGVKPDQLEKFLGQKLGTVSPEQLNNLRDIYNAINQGEASWKDFLDNKEEEEGPKMPQANGASAKNGKKDPKKENLKQMYDKFEDERERLGDEKFFQVIGSAGYEKYQEISTVVECKKILAEMNKKK